MLIVGCLLFGVRCRCLLFGVLVAVCCLLFAVSVCVVCCLLFGVWCSLRVAG